MTNQSGSKIDKTHDHSVDVDNYDRGITPAETAARKEREQEDYKHSRSEDQPAPDSIDTTSGYTVDKEGLANNFPIEPEMYVNEPGDLRQQEASDKAERANEMREVNQTDEDGKLTMEKDDRGKGTGAV